MATNIRGTRADTWRVTLTVNGKDFGVWDRRSGGRSSSGSQSFRPGAMGEQYSLGGVPTTDNLVLSRNYRLQRDHDRVQELIDGEGEAHCVVKQLPLDKNKNAYGNPIVWTGTLDAVAVPEHDSSATDAAMIEIEIVPDGRPTAIPAV